MYFWMWNILSSLDLLLFSVLCHCKLNLSVVFRLLYRKQRNFEDVTLGYVPRFDRWIHFISFENKGPPAFRTKFLFSFVQLNVQVSLILTQRECSHIHYSKWKSSACSENWFSEAGNANMICDITNFEVKGPLQSDVSLLVLPVKCLRSTEWGMCSFWHDMNVSTFITQSVNRDLCSVKTRFWEAGPTYIICDITNHLEAHPGDIVPSYSVC